MKVSVPLSTREDESFLEFLSFYPSYGDTMAIDALRHEEYPHLDRDGHVCLDYTGVGLFSSLQRSPELHGGFGIGLSPTSASLATHAMYMEGGMTESFFRRRALQYLSLNEDDYYIVFTANALSAFKLLAHSYPFHELQSFLFAYDHSCENVEAIGECAHAKGAHVHSANLLNPLSRIDAEDLRKRLQGKRKPSTQKTANKGLFAYPYTSRITGGKNSSQWIPEAQQNGWHVLLDVTSADAKFSDSLGLALFTPDFLICSFYCVFGEDPTGFGCLAIKKSVLRTLGDSSRARAIGMMKIVSKGQASSSSCDETLDTYTHIQVPEETLVHKTTCLMHGFSFQEEMDAHRSSDFTPLHGTPDHVTRFKAISSNSEVSRGTELHAPTLNVSYKNPTGETFSLDERLVSTNIQSAMQSGMGDSGHSRGSNRPLMHGVSMDMSFTCRGLDHAEMLGNKGVAIRLGALLHWLISSLSRLRHPKPNSIPLVKIYSPMSSAERGSTVAFTLSDTAGNRLDPKRVQMLADRNNISLRTGVIAGTVSSDGREADEDPRDVGCVELPNYKWRTKGETMHDVNVPVVCASLGFLNNFSDVYRLWLFISRFLDPDFVRQELWHYQALNQETIEI